MESSLLTRPTKLELFLESYGIWSFLLIVHRGVFCARRGPSKTTRPSTSRRDHRRLFGVRNQLILFAMLLVSFVICKAEARKICFRCWMRKSIHYQRKEE